jgi:hypothetical protein
MTHHLHQTGRHGGSHTLEDCALRWVLTRGDAAITCEIDANPDASFDVRIAASSRRGFVEHFDTATAALERHAEVANQLLEEGWVVSEHSPRPSRLM